MGNDLREKLRINELHIMLLIELRNLVCRLKLDKNVSDEILKIINKYDPISHKKYRKKISKEEKVKFDKEGNLTHILCKFSGEFLPATLEFFYQATENSNDMAGNGLREASKLGEAIYKKFNRESNKIRNSILERLYKITSELSKLNELKPDYTPMKLLAEGKIDLKTGIEMCKKFKILG